MSSNMHRQGDLLLTAIDQLPDGLTLRPDNMIVRGEATGHAHRLQAGRVWEDAQSNLFLKVLIQTQVVHQEHHPIVLQAGSGSWATVEGHARRTGCAGPDSDGNESEQ